MSSISTCRTYLKTTFIASAAPVAPVPADKLSPWSVPMKSNNCRTPSDSSNERSNAKKSRVSHRDTPYRNRFQLNRQATNNNTKKSVIKPAIILASGMLLTNHTHAAALASRMVQAGEPINPATVSGAQDQAPSRQFNDVD